jgi:hypothetical protein
MAARSHDNRPALNYDQFAEAGPSPTKTDAFSTIVHLADSAAFNLKHGAMHHARVQDLISQLPESELHQQIIWNHDHAIKHHIAANEDLTSLIDHVKSNPYLKDAVNETAQETHRLQRW